MASTINTSVVTEDRLYTLFDLPVTLPQSNIEAGISLAIATVQLPANCKIDLRWLQLFVIASDQPTLTVNPAYVAGGIATVFLIQNWTPISNPWIQTVNTAIYAPLPTGTSNFPIISTYPVATPLEITTAGTYTFVILNNTTNATLTMSVTGSVTLDIDPLQ
jgi:hypothetical protein